MEKSRIECEQRLSDYSRKYPNQPRQMLTSFSQAEKLKLDDNFFNENGFEVNDLLTWMKEKGMEEDERFQTISAEEY